MGRLAEVRDEKIRANPGSRQVVRGFRQRTRDVEVGQYPGVAGGIGIEAGDLRIIGRFDLFDQSLSFERFMLRYFDERLLFDRGAYSLIPTQGGTGHGNGNGWHRFCGECGTHADGDECERQNRPAKSVCNLVPSHRRPPIHWFCKCSGLPPGEIRIRTPPP